MPEFYTATIVPGQLPVYKLRTLEEPLEDEVTVKVLAVGFSHLAIARASGAHYLASGAGEALIGVDGVGELDGKLVFFTTFQPTLGTYGETINVKKASLTEVGEVKDREATIANIAALNNSVFSVVAALNRIPGGVKGATLAILGVTGAGGTLAAQTAKKFFGVSRVVGLARDATKLKQLKEDGLIDDYVAFSEEDPKLLAAKLGNVDVVLDYVNGKPAEDFIARINQVKAVPSQALWWVLVGGAAGAANLTLLNHIFRSNNFYILGSGIGPHTKEAFAQIMKDIVKILKSGDVTFPLEKLLLKDIGKYWEEGPLVGGKRRYFSIE